MANDPKECHTNAITSYPRQVVYQILFPVCCPNTYTQVASFAVICRSLPIQRGFLELVLGALVVHSRHHIKE
eukprot:1177190-Amorphochlora_amoeboformis.AAC.1